jgi:hypothetical protein
MIPMMSLGVGMGPPPLPLPNPYYMNQDATFEQTTADDLALLQDCIAAGILDPVSPSERAVRLRHPWGVARHYHWRGNSPHRSNPEESRPTGRRATRVVTSHRCQRQQTYMRSMDCHDSCHAM